MKRTVAMILAVILLLSCGVFAASSAAVAPEDECSFKNVLFLVEGETDAFTLKNANTGKYLTCDGNATLGDTATPFRITETSGGYKIALAEATGGKSAGSALHFGSSNRLSFGDASAFAAYAYAGDDLFTTVDGIEAGQYYLFAYVSGENKYALSGTPYGTGSSARIETESVTINFKESPYKGLLFTVGGAADALTFKNVDNGLYLADEGNATLSDTPVTFTAEAVEGGFHVNRVSYSGDHAALHLGSNNRISYGSASVFAAYEYMPHNGEELFLEAAEISVGKTYMLVYKSGNSLYAVSGTVYNPGVSSRIETKLTTISLYDEEKIAFEDSAYLSLLFKVSKSDGFYTFKHVESGTYLGYGGNAALTVSPSSFTVTKISGGFEIARDGSSSSALHVGSGNRLSYGTASAFNFYEYVSDDAFAPVDEPIDGSFCLIVYTKSGVNYAMTGTTVNSGSSSRIETAETDINLYVCGEHALTSRTVTAYATFTTPGSAESVCRYCGSTVYEAIPAETIDVYGDAIVTTVGGVSSVAIVGLLEGAELDPESADYIEIRLSFTSGGSVVNEKTVRTHNIYKTVTGVASTNASTASSQGTVEIDADYLFGVRVNGVPAGAYTLEITASAILGNESVASAVKTVEFSV